MKTISIKLTSLPDPDDLSCKQNFGNDLDQGLDASFAALFQAILKAKGKLQLKLVWEYRDNQLNGYITLKFDDSKIGALFQTLSLVSLGEVKEKEIKRPRNYAYSYALTRSSESYSPQAGVEFCLPKGLDQVIEVWRFLDQHASLTQKEEWRIELCATPCEYDEIGLQDMHLIYDRIQSQKFNFSRTKTIDDFIDPQLKEQSSTYKAELQKDRIRDVLRRYLSDLENEKQFGFSINVFGKKEDVALLTAVHTGVNLLGENAFELEDTTDQRVISGNIWNKSDDWQKRQLKLIPYAQTRAIFCLPTFDKNTQPKIFKLSSDPRVGRENSVLPARDVNREQPVILKKETLTAHAFITGGSGRGKTTTVKEILRKLWPDDSKNQIPFLIIEPTKTEYRDLKLEDSALGRDLLVLSPGREDLCPMRINPFDLGMELEPADYLIKAVGDMIKSAVPLFGPMPMLLQEALRKVFEKHRWNILNKNEKARELPMLTELVEAISETIEQRGYSGEFGSDLKAAFETRFVRLTELGIGLIFSLNQSVPNLDTILSRPVIVELDQLSDEDANLITIFLLSAIREYRRKQGSIENKLRHLLVLEEAHVLCGQEEDLTGDGATFNPKAEASKLIERFLAEVRALGQGVLVADQSASLMPQGVLRNTRTKIIHGVSEGTDRRALTEAVNMPFDFERVLERLPGGDAIFISQDYMRPLLIHIERTRVKVDADDDILDRLQKDEQHQLIRQSIVEKHFWAFQAKFEARVNGFRRMLNNYFKAVSPVLFISSANAVSVNKDYMNWVKDQSQKSEFKILSGVDMAVVLYKKELKRFDQHFDFYQGSCFGIGKNPALLDLYHQYKKLLKEVAEIITMEKKQHEKKKIQRDN